MVNEVVLNASVLPVSELISRVIEDVFKTIRAARDVLVERQAFTELSSYLECLLPILQEILQRSPASSDALTVAIIVLLLEVKAVQALTFEYGKKNRLYLLLNCR